MPPRVTLQVLAKPLPRSLAEQFRPPIRTTTPAWPSTWPSTSRAASRLRRLPPSTCLRCGIRVQSRNQSTSATPPPPTNPEPRPDGHTSSPSSSAAESSALPSAHESSRPALQARFSTFMDTLQTRFMTASQTLNDLTGYSAIEAIKTANTQLETDLAAAQARLRAARHGYKSLTAHQASTQREVTTLLARKDTWSPADLERFTALYRSDHELEARVAAAAAELTEAEADESRLSAALNAGILRRYHEEQVWSDRIRRQSTWGTWGLMGVNVLLFIGLQFVAEPWKRQRLVKGFADAERGVWDEVRTEVGEVRGLLLEVREGRRAEGAAGAVVAGPSVEGTVGSLGGAGEGVVVSDAETPPRVLEGLAPSWQWWKEVLLDPARWRPVLEDLYSERRIALRMRDASALALESAVTGAAVAAGVVFLILRRT